MILPSKHHCLSYIFQSHSIAKAQQYPTLNLRLWNPSALTILRQTLASVHLNTFSCSSTSTASLTEMVHSLCLFSFSFLLSPAACCAPLHFKTGSQHEINLEVLYATVISNQINSLPLGKGCPSISGHILVCVCMWVSEREKREKYAQIFLPKLKSLPFLAWKF